MFNYVYEEDTMTLLNGDVETLSELGLSSLQSKVYLFLSKTKNQTAKSIANNSEIARPDVYRVLTQLEKTGLIHRIIANPEEFQAIPIDECISTLIQRRRAKTAQLQERALQIIKNHQNNHNHHLTDQEKQFMLIPKKETLFNKVEKLMNNAQECICFLGTEKKILNYIHNYQHLFESALKRKVPCKIILEKPQNHTVLNEILNPLKRYAYFSSKLISKKPSATFSIFDQKDIMLSINNEDVAGKYPAIWSNNKCFVDLSQDHFDLLWKSLPT